jgi:SAM-dependent MidA family methyltransferase
MPDGARLEVNERAQNWMAEVAARLARGYVLTLDYGYPAARMYAPWRRQGTLMAFYRHAVSPSPLAHPGEQDLTAHVDFTGLALAGRGQGLEPAGFTTQREFLTALGIHEAVSAGGLPLEETLARRRAVLALTDPAGLGRVRVLLQAKGVDGAGLTGFAGSPPAWESLLAGIAHEEGGLP